MTNVNLSALALNRQNLISPLINGGTLGFSLGTSPVTVLTQNTQAQKVTFHNPGTINIYLCQAFDMNGNALVPGAANGGSWELLPGAVLQFTGDGVGGIWLAIAATGSGNPLTIAVSQTIAE